MVPASNVNQKNWVILLEAMLDMSNTATNSPVMVARCFSFPFMV